VLGRGRAPDRARVVDQEVEGAQGSRSGVHHRAGGSRVGEVGTDRGAAPAQRRNARRHRIRRPAVPVAHHVGAGFRERDGHGFAEAR